MQEVSFLRPAKNNADAPHLDCITDQWLPKQKKILISARKLYCIVIDRYEKSGDRSMKIVFSFYKTLLLSALLLLACSLAAHQTLPGDLDSQEIRFTETNPPVGPVRPVAEFEPASHVLIRYPLGIPLSLVVHLANTAQVVCLVSSSQQSAAATAFTNAGVNMANLSFLNAATDSYWTRDYGPWFIFDGNGQYGLVDFVYNRPRPNDNQIPQTFATQFDLPYYGMNIQQTGGNYMCDGINTAAQTTLVYEENGNNQTNVNSKMLSYMGAQNYLVVQDPNNTYIDHIDCWAKILAPDKVLVRSVPTSHAQYAAIEAAANYFATRNCAWGYPWRVYRVNTPSNQPYTNSLILNKKVFVPQMGGSYDAAALQAYRDAMPGYEVIGVSGSSSAPWESTDALHCRTHEIPDKNMLHIAHQPWHGIVPEGDIALYANITAHSGQPLYPDSLFISYKVNSGTWQRSYLMPNTRSVFGTTLGGFAPGDTIRYFVHAADQSGRSYDHPVFAAADPHWFVIQPDMMGPEIQHTPITSIGNQNEPISFVVNASDPSGISQLLFRYQIDAGQVWSFPMDPLTEDSYIFQYYPDFVAGDSVFHYSFVAYDGSNPPNTSQLPVDGSWFSVPVNPVSGSDQAVPVVTSGIRAIYPNPFQAKDELLTLEYCSDNKSPITLKIFNIRGQLIYEHNSISAKMGVQQITWDGKAFDGNKSTSGVYLIQISQGSNSYKAKLIKVK